MSETLLRTFILIFMINGALLLGQTFLIENTPYSMNFNNNAVIGLFFNLDENNQPINATSEFTSSIPSQVQLSAQQSGENTTLLIDAIQFLFNFIILLLKLLIAPLLLLALGFSLPLPFTLFIIMPIIILYAFGLVFFIRGSGN